MDARRGGGWEWKCKWLFWSLLICVAFGMLLLEVAAFEMAHVKSVLPPTAYIGYTESIHCQFLCNNGKGRYG